MFIGLPSLHALNGWLSPEGKLFPCKPREHIALSELLIDCLGLSRAKQHDNILEKLGWLKLSINLLPGEDMSFANRCQQAVWIIHRTGTGEQTWDVNEMTQAQFNAVLEWHEIHKRSSVLLVRMEKRLQGLGEDCSDGQVAACG